ncbi:NUDIX domain-containing protein [Stratiformator vulcanicus]|uniref:NADH pyrophosphatase n=1 Tax=Stratiformator vulcanicus TaxID=2527980 RepID=A0A517QYU1_9PLAN|nr:NUDIX domain-containing protein [Stratiformator vulcanicus]QDT36801.1 NADH pyrophosphatase [Stratiformator vulcanicus]
MSESVIDAFRYCPRCGTPVENPGTVPLVCKNCGFQHFFNPIVAVGGIVTDPEDRVLLVIRARDPGKGKFGVPGGFVDRGETLEEALIREVVEETSLKAIETSYLCSFPNDYTFKGITAPVTDAFFRVEVESFEPLKAEESEISSFHLCVPGENELSNMAFESNRRALETFLK